MSRTFEGEDLDATLLLLAELGFVACSDERFIMNSGGTSTGVAPGGIWSSANAVADDFGRMEDGLPDLLVSAVRSNALWAIGRW